VRNWPTEPITEKPVNKWRASFAILFLIAGYLDNGIDDPTVRELNAITKLGNVRIVRLIDQLEANGWISVERGDDAREERNHYRINAD
jgi:DNA-binding MarR family transcriptional regulator